MNNQTKARGFVSRRALALALVALAAIAIGVLLIRPKRPDARVTIRLIGEAYAPLEALGNLKDKFEEESGIRVEIVQKDHQSVVAELDQELATRNVTYDVILMPHRLLGRLVEKQQVRALDEIPSLASPVAAEILEPKDATEKWWHEISWYHGRPYGAPFSQLSMYVAYRRDLLEDSTNRAAFARRYRRELRAPTNWTEYIQLAEFFTRPHEGLYGTYVEGQQHVALWYEWLNVLYAFGADVIELSSGSEYGDIIVNSPQAKMATEAYLGLLAYSPPESMNYNWDDALAVLQSGKAFMGLVWHDAAPYLEDPKQSKFAGKFGYISLRGVNGQPVGQLEGWTYLIPTESKHPTEATRFIIWAMSPEVQLQQTLKGGSSPRPSVYANPEVQRIPFTPAFLEALGVGTPKPTFPESSAITEVLTRRLSQILSRQISPSSGLDAAATDISAILGAKAKLRYPVK